MSMSGAAVAATSAANNSISGTRRRQGAVEALSAEAVSDGVVPGAVANDRVPDSGKDPSNCSRGNFVLGKQRDVMVIKKNIAASSVSPRRRKPISRPEKSKWETVLNILLKNLLLLVVLFWLGQVIWNWVDGSARSGGASFARLEFEDRISEVETSLKKMTKMTQVQMDVIDKRGKQIEEKSSILESELKNLVDRADNLDKIFGELSGAGFLSKQEFEIFVNDLKKESRSQENGNKNLSLDDVRLYAREVIMKEIEKHAADGLGRVDYALASGGGRVIRHSEPYISGKASKLLSITKTRNGVNSNAQKMLEPSFGEPGQCFPLQGNRGFIEIKLRTGIIADAFSLEHVAKNVAFDRSSAPKDCQVSGWFEAPEGGGVASDNTEKFVLVEHFSYDLEKSNTQTFSIETPIPTVVNMIRLDILSNHGSASHTCIYRFRVHGHEPGSSMPMVVDQ